MKGVLFLSPCPPSYIDENWATGAAVRVTSAAMRVAWKLSEYASRAVPLRGRLVARGLHSRVFRLLESPKLRALLDAPPEPRHGGGGGAGGAAQQPVAFAPALAPFATSKTPAPFALLATSQKVTANEEADLLDLVHLLTGCIVSLLRDPSVKESVLQSSFKELVLLDR